MSSKIASAEKLLLKPSEVFGPLLGIGNNLGYAWIKAGIIPSVRMNGRFFIPRKALEETIERMGRQAS